LSAQRARDAAQRLLDLAQIRKVDIEGRTVDLAPIMARCDVAPGPFRQMIENALYRIVRSRGGDAAKPPQVPRGEL